MLEIDQYHQEIILGEFGETVYNFWEMVLFGALNDLKICSLFCVYLTYLLCRAAGVAVGSAPASSKHV